MINRHPLPWLTRAVNAPTTRNLTDRLEKLAVEYHMRYQHSADQQSICPACCALDPHLLRSPSGGVDR